MAHPASTNVDTYLKRAYALRGPSEATQLYDEWAANYDTQLRETGYASPRRCVETIVKHIGATSSKSLQIFDAGCGTGLVGDYLRQSSLAAAFVADGVDISPAMLDIARKKHVYRELRVADLNSRIESPDSSYDVVACVGTLTKGHVGPNVLREFVRILVAGGLIVATVHDEIWESGGFKAEVHRLRDESTVEIIGTESFGILEQDAEGGRMIIVAKISISEHE